MRALQSMASVQQWNTTGKCYTKRKCPSIIYFEGVGLGSTRVHWLGTLEVSRQKHATTSLLPIRKHTSVDLPSRCHHLTCTIYIYIHIYIILFICVCVCVCILMMYNITLFRPFDSSLALGGIGLRVGDASHERVLNTFMHGPRVYIELRGQGDGGATGLTVINLGGEPGKHQINATDFKSATFINAKLR